MHFAGRSVGLACVVALLASLLGCKGETAACLAPGPPVLVDASRLTPAQRMEADSRKASMVVNHEGSLTGLAATIQEIDERTWENPYEAYATELNLDARLTSCIEQRAFEARKVTGPLKEVAAAILSQCRAYGYFGEETTPRMDDAVASTLKYRACAARGVRWPWMNRSAPSNSRG